MDINLVQYYLRDFDMEAYIKESTNPSEQPNAEVWPNRIESIFLEAIQVFSTVGQKKYALDESYDSKSELVGRNDIISRYIFIKTGLYRARKQVSSHIQVWAHCKKAPSNREMPDHIFKLFQRIFRLYYSRSTTEFGTSKKKLKRVISFDSAASYSSTETANSVIKSHNNINTPYNYGPYSVPMPYIYNEHEKEYKDGDFNVNTQHRYNNNLINIDTGSQLAYQSPILMNKTNYIPFGTDSLGSVSFKETNSLLDHSSTGTIEKCLVNPDDNTFTKKQKLNPIVEMPENGFNLWTEGTSEKSKKLTSPKTKTKKTKNTTKQESVGSRELYEYGYLNTASIQGNNVTPISPLVYKDCDDMNKGGTWDSLCYPHQLTSGINSEGEASIVTLVKPDMCLSQPMMNSKFILDGVFDEENEAKNFNFSVKASNKSTKNELVLPSDISLLQLKPEIDKILEEKKQNITFSSLNSSNFSDNTDYSLSALPISSDNAPIWDTVNEWCSRIQVLNSNNKI